MISKGKIKLIKSLEVKKFRKESGLFVAEGNKLVTEILGSPIITELLIGTAEFMSSVAPKISTLTEVFEADNEDIKKASLLKNPQQCIAICRIPQFDQPDIIRKGTLVLCLDKIQDPGNLGTILRLADWFGIEEIFCSPDSADIYNPKAVQATMGAICRVRTWYSELEPFLNAQAKAGIPVFGTFLDGNNIYTDPLGEQGIIVLGNEGRGISPGLETYIGHRLTIPDFSLGEGAPESLNVSIAAAIVCSEFRRRSYYSK